MNNVLFFFGAGATASLGSPVTYVQERFFRELVNIDKSVEERLKAFKKAFPNLFADSQSWKDFVDDIRRTLWLLYDGDGSQKEAVAASKRAEAEQELIKILKYQKEKYKLNQFLRIYVYPWYDWLAFVSVARTLFSQGDKVTLQDVLSVIVKASVDGISLPTRELFQKEKKRKLPIYVNYPSRLEGALRAYKLLLFKLFKHTLRNSVKHNKKLWEKYESFTSEIIKVSIKNFEVKEADIRSALLSLSCATLNWDPVFPMFFIKSCKVLNDSLIRENKRIYLSYGAPFVVRKFSGSDRGLYIFGEESVSLVNSMTLDKRKCSLKMKTLKFFVPHGLMNLRVCPRCQNAFIILPDDVGRLTYEKFLDIFLLDPVPAEIDVKLMNERYRAFFDEKNPSFISCPVCDTPTYFHDTVMLIQSVIKPKNAPIMEKVAVDYWVTFSKTGHLIFLGYSFPVDDIPHLLSLLTMGVSGNNENGLKKKFSVVLFNNKNRHLYKERWLSVDYVLSKLDRKREEDDRDYKTIENILKLAKKENIRLNFLGVPDIFAKLPLDDIITWRKPS